MMAQRGSRTRTLTHKGEPSPGHPEGITARPGGRGLPQGHTQKESLTQKKGRALNPGNFLRRRPSPRGEASNTAALLQAAPLRAPVTPASDLSCAITGHDPEASLNPGASLALRTLSVGCPPPLPRAVLARQSTAGAKMGCQKLAITVAKTPGSGRVGGRLTQS